MTLLARTEGIWAETAGGVTLAVTRKLIEQGRIPRDDEDIVICVTGNGLKTQDAVTDLLLERPQIIRPSLEDFEPIYDADQGGGGKGGADFGRVILPILAPRKDVGSRSEGTSFRGAKIGNQAPVCGHGGIVS